MKKVIALLNDAYLYLEHNQENVIPIWNVLEDSEYISNLNTLEDNFELSSS